MAEIYLCAMASNLGPSMPTDHGAWTRDKVCPGGGTVKELVLSIGDSTISVWPADPDKIDEFGDKLKRVAAELREASSDTGLRAMDYWSR